MRVDFLERLQAAIHGREVVLARAHLARPPFMLDTGGRYLELPGGAIDAVGIEAFLGAAKGVGRNLPLRSSGLERGAQLACFEIESRRGGHGTLALGRR